MSCHFQFEKLIRRSLREAHDSTLEIRLRKLAIQSLAGRPLQQVRPVLEALIAPQENLEIIKTAISSLGKFNEPVVNQILMNRWKTFPSQVQMQILEILLGN